MAAECQDVGSRAEDQPLRKVEVTDLLYIVSDAFSRAEAQHHSIQEDILVEALGRKLNDGWDT